MSSIPLQLVLLVSVVTSQILGGNSCCCLERAIFSYFVTDGSEATETDHSQGTSPACQQSPKRTCPKCSGRKGGDVLPELGARKMQPCHRPQVSEDNQCRCVKLVINATTTGKPFSLELSAAAWSYLVQEGNPEREVDSLRLRDYEVPVRFGGHSWRSIACIWNN